MTMHNNETYLLNFIKKDIQYYLLQEYLITITLQKE